VLSHLRMTAWSLGVVLASVAADPAVAAQPSDTLLPATTKGYISVPDVDTLRTRWNETQLGQFMRDPMMEPFMDDMTRQVREKATRLHQTLGLTLADLEEVAGGEASIALVEPAKGQVALAVLVDVSGQQDQARALLAKMDSQLKKQKAKRNTQTVEGSELIVYTLPSQSGEKKFREAAFFLHQDMLGGSDSRAVAEAILHRFAAPAKDNLANVAAYRTIMDRCRRAAEPLAPELRWYLDPFGYINAVRTADPERRRRQGKDLAKILMSQGFAAVQGVGGYVNFNANGQYELLHRTVIYAPPVGGKQGDEKYTLAARMLQFPNGGALAPEPWVPRQIALYASLNWELQRAFDASETLIDALIGQEGAFQEILDGIREDQLGPQIDLRSQLVGHLGRRATIITDYQLPITPQSERWLFAAETTDQTELVQTICRVMESDPTAKRHDFLGCIVWEITDEDTELPELTIESPAFDVSLASAGDEQDMDERGSLPSSAVCVAYDRFLVASHYDFLVKVLEKAAERENLAASVDYQTAMKEVEKLSSGEICLRLFSRTDEDFRPTYELIRAGRMPEAESLLGRLLNMLLGEGDEDVLRPQVIDGSKLPDFEMARRYLGPAGLTVQSEKDGWIATGFMLNKEAP